MRMVPHHHHGPSDANGGHAPEAGGACAPADGGRLNLLLSCGGWQADPWVERLPPLLEPMGVRSLRATSAREAGELIRRTPVHVAVVDLGLPLDAARGEARTSAEEAGPRLLEILRRLDAPPPTVVVKRGRTSRDDQREMSAALRAGAFAIIDRPRGPGDLERVLEVLRRVLVRYYAGRWPGAAS